MGKSWKTRITLVLLLLIPAVWAGFKQSLVRRSPPGAAITVAMGDILAAMDQIAAPDPKLPETALRYDLTPRDFWVVLIKTEPEASGADLFREVRELDRALPAGVTTQAWKILVESQTEQRWLLSARPETKNDAPAFRFYIDAEGRMEAADDSLSASDTRDDLFRRTGIYLPGPFTGSLRPRAWCGGQPGTQLGLRTRQVIQSLELNVLDDRMPPRGGLMFLGESPETDREFRFRLLSYRRLQLGKGPWEGYVELLARADYRSPRQEIHLATGTARLRDIIDLQKERRIGAAAEYSLRINQEVIKTGRED